MSITPLSNRCQLAMLALIITFSLSILVYYIPVAHNELASIMADPDYFEEPFDHTTCDLRANQFDDSCHACDQCSTNENSRSCRLCEASKSLIFFLETSDRNALNSRQVCAVESASAQNPQARIVVYVTSEKNCSGNEVMKVICSLANVQFEKINVTEELKEANLTSVEDTLQHHSKWKTVHTSDILRLVFLYKHGGLYLDLDCIVKRPLMTLDPGVGQQNVAYLSTGVIKMYPRSDIMRVALDSIVGHFSGQLWTEVGPLLLMRTFDQLCPGERIKENGICKGVKVYPVLYFYPIPYDNLELFFDSKKAAKFVRMVRNSYIVHFWNALSFNFTLSPGLPQGLGLLAHQYCPKVYTFFH